MLLGVDISSNQASFDFGLAVSQGVKAVYIKLGGDNIPRYESGSYVPRVDAAHAAGVAHVGSYWITGGHDPVQAADFFASHLEAFGAPDFIVLDNESLDSGNVYSDGEAAAWVAETIRVSGASPERVLHYGSKSFMESHPWPQLLATGCAFLIADYNGTPLVNHVPSTIPAERVVGHQYADNGSIGGVSPVDLNAFTDSFLSTTTASVADVIKLLENDEMKLATSTGKLSPLLCGPLGSINVTDPLEIAAAEAAYGTIQLNDLQLSALHNVTNRYAENAGLVLKNA